MPPLTLADLPLIKSSFAVHGKRAWCYYAPFLLSYSLPPDRPLTWEACGGSLCLFVHRRGRDGGRTDLMVPPLPCSEPSLAACGERIGRRNPDRSLRILWADGEDAQILRASGYEMRLKEEEYLYDPSLVVRAEGSRFRDLRKRVRRFEREQASAFRRMVPSDRDGAAGLLQMWRRTQGRKRSFLLDWGYTKAALKLVGQLEERDLSGWVVEIDGEVRAFGLAGEMGPDLGHFFVAKSDPAIFGLSEYLRWRVCGEMMRYGRINDAGDLDLPGLRQHKMKFRPVERIAVYSGWRTG